MPKKKLEDVINKAVDEAVEEVMDAIEDGAEEAPSVTLPLNRDNLTYITAGLWLYEHKGNLKECMGVNAFASKEAKDFNLKVGDVVICSNKQGATLAVVRK